MNADEHGSDRETANPADVPGRMPSMTSAFIRVHPCFFSAVSAVNLPAFSFGS